MTRPRNAKATTFITTKNPAAGRLANEHPAHSALPALRRHDQGERSLYRPSAARRAHQRPRPPLLCLDAAALPSQRLQRKEPPMKRLLAALAIALSIAAPAAARDASPSFPGNAQGEWCYQGINGHEATYLAPGVIGRDNCESSPENIVVTPKQLSAGDILHCDLIDGRIISDNVDEVHYRATLSCRTPDRHWIERDTFIAPNRGMAGLIWKQK